LASIRRLFPDARYGSRGNGLKFVKNVVEKRADSLFQTGDAKLELKKGDNELNITKEDSYIGGCIALIKF